MKPYRVSAEREKEVVVRDRNEWMIKNWSWLLMLVVLPWLALLFFMSITCEVASVKGYIHPEECPAAPPAPAQTTVLQIKTEPVSSASPKKE